MSNNSSQNDTKNAMVPMVFAAIMWSVFFGGEYGVYYDLLHLAMAIICSVLAIATYRGDVG